MSLITFIIPSIARSTLSRTLDSLLSLSCDDWNALIIFDGVENNLSEEYLNNAKFEFLQSTKVGKQFANGNGDIISSAGFVRNIGIRHATSDWIGFLDDDDVVYENYVQDLKNELEKKNDLDFILFRMNADKVVPAMNVDSIIKNEVGISFCVKRQFIETHNLLFRQNGVEDFTFAIDAVKFGAKILISKSVTYEVCSENRDKQRNRTVFVFRECEHENLDQDFAKNSGMGATDHVALSFVDYLSKFYTVKMCCPTKTRRYFDKVEFIPFSSYEQVCDEIVRIKPDVVIVVANPKLIYHKDYTFYHKTIFWQHNHPDEMKHFNIKQMILSKSIKIVLPSLEAANFCKNYYENDNQIFGIYNGIRKEFFVKKNVKKREFVIAYIGCLTKQKGLYEFLHAAKSLPQFKFEIFGSFDLYGKGTVDEDFKKVCEDIINSTTNITLQGAFSAQQLSERIQTVDLVIANPNVGNKETCCLSALEAMATGTPVIAGGNSIIDSIVSQGGIAYTDSLEKSILRLISDREKMKQMSESCLIYTKSFDWDSIALQWVDFLQKNMSF